MSEAVQPVVTGGDGGTSRRKVLMWLLVLATVVVYGKDFLTSQGEFIDAPHHLMNGIFVLDALHDPVAALSDPKSFAIHYYQHFPAVNIGYYPPVFPILEAVVMSVVGVGAAAGQLTVLLLAVITALFAFGWFRLRFDDLWATAATLLMMLTPYLVYWGRDIMLEVPVLALVMGAMWSFERLLRMDRPTWTASLVWSGLSILAIWTKQHALMLLAIYAVTTFTTGRWRHLTRIPILTGMTLLAASAAALVIVQIKLGGDAIGHSVGFTSRHVADRFNWDQWMYYARRLPQVIYWPVLVAAVLGMAKLIRGRMRHSSALIVWIVAFYLMHSYMKAQDIRYAVLVIPPVIALAVMGVQSFFRMPDKHSHAGVEHATSHAIRSIGSPTSEEVGHPANVAHGGATLDQTTPLRNDQSTPPPLKEQSSAMGHPASGESTPSPLKRWVSRPGMASAVAMVLLLIYNAWGAYRVQVPRVSPAYQRAAEDLCDRLGPYSCLTFVPERAARPAVMHRLAVEQRLAVGNSRTGERDIYSFGRILRAAQVLGGGKERWPDASAALASLDEWNVKYILRETPTPIDQRGRDGDVAALVEELVSGPYRLAAEYDVDLTVPRWPVRISKGDFPHRKLQLFERTLPIPFNPKASPPIQPKRVDFTITEGT